MAEGKPLVGVDIGATSIKVCQLKETRRGYSLVRAGYHPLEPQTIVDRHVMNPQVVIEALQRTFHDFKIRQKEVALSVSGQSVISRKITVPIMTTSELDEQIQWEAENHIPFDIKDVNVDYEVLRRRPEAGQMDLLLVAAKREEINDYVHIAKQAKLRPIIVDIDAFTIQNVFAHNRGLPHDQTFAIINVGATQASINIVSRGTSAFTRDIANGGNYLTEQIVKQVGVPYEQAEELKLQASQAHAASNLPPRLFETIEHVCDTIAGEIQRSLDFFLATSGEERIGRVYLTGGTANLQQLSAAVERRSRVSVERMEPFERIAVEGRDVDPQLIQKRGSQLSVALGLSMRKSKEKRDGVSASAIRVNLLPQAVERRATPEAGPTWLLAVMGLVVLEIVGLFFFHQTKEDELADVQQQLNELSARVGDISSKIKDHPEIKKRLEELRAREDAIAKLEAARIGPTAVLLEVSRVLTKEKGPTTDAREIEQLRQENPLAVYNPAWDPRRIWLTLYDENERSVRLEGLARDASDVSELAQRLKLSVYFEDVQVLPGQQEPTSKDGLDMVKFALQVKVKY
jgi:type IV pilus assembly protein PilM